MIDSLERIFGGDDVFGGWWIIILFFLFMAFQDVWEDFDVCTWIPFLILLLIVCSMSGAFDRC